MYFNSPFGLYKRGKESLCQQMFTMLDDDGLMRYFARYDNGSSDDVLLLVSEREGRAIERLDWFIYLFESSSAASR